MTILGQVGGSKKAHKYGHYRVEIIGHGRYLDRSKNVGINRQLGQVGGSKKAHKYWASSGRNHRTWQIQVKLAQNRRTSIHNFRGSGGSKKAHKYWVSQGRYRRTWQVLRQVKMAEKRRKNTNRLEVTKMHAYVKMISKHFPLENSVKQSRK